MRERVVVNFNLSGTRAEDEAFRAATGIEELMSCKRSPIGFYSIALPPSDPRLGHLRTALVELGASMSERLERSYTIREAAQAPAVWLSVARAPRGEGGPRHGTSFDLADACNRCGTGAAQTSPLVVLAQELPQPTAQCWTTLAGDILVAASVRSGWEGINGLDLLEARLPDGSPTGWFQLLMREPLPPLSAATRGIRCDTLCDGCRRSGFFHAVDVPVELRFRERAEYLFDRAHSTWEWFGHGILREPFHRSVLAQPLLTIPGGAMEPLLRSWPKGLVATPVSFDGCA